MKIKNTCLAMAVGVALLQFGVCTNAYAQPNPLPETEAELPPIEFEAGSYFGVGIMGGIGLLQSNTVQDFFANADHRDLYRTKALTSTTADFGFGIGLQYEYFINKNFGISAQFNYHSTGAIIRSEYESNNTTEPRRMETFSETRVVQNSIAIPLMLRFYLQGHTGIYLGLGAEVQFGTGGTIRGNDLYITQTNAIDTATSESYSAPLTFGLSTGLAGCASMGFRAAVNGHPLLLEARYSLGLTGHTIATEEVAFGGDRSTLSHYLQEGNRAKNESYTSLPLNDWKLSTLMIQVGYYF